MTEQTRTQVSIDFRSLDLLPYGIIVLNSEGIVLFYNEREEQIASRDRSDVLGKNFFTEIAPCTQAGEFFDRFKEVMSSDVMTVNFSFTFPFPEGSRDVEISMSGFQLDQRQLCLVSVRDVTEVEIVRDRILMSEKFAGVGEVVSGVVHNFRNVLMSIQTWLTVLKREPCQMSGRGILALEQISKALSDGKEMFQTIRTGPLGAPDSSVVAVDVNDVVRAAISQSASGDKGGTASEGHTTIHADLTPSLHVMAPPRDLREVIVNLLYNALDASKEKGAVSVRTGREGTNITIAISDTGAGMTKETQRRLFQPLFTTKGASGTGLGLSTSYSTIRRLNGSITVTSVLGEGSQFTIVLPAYAGEG